MASKGIYMWNSSFQVQADERLRERIEELEEAVFGVIHSDEDEDKTATIWCDQNCVRCSQTSCTVIRYYPRQ